MARKIMRAAAWFAAGASVSIVLVALVTLVFEPPFIYGLVTRIVVVDDATEPADLIYVLNGRVDVRAGHAARMYAEGLGSRILLAHTREMARRPDRPLSELIAGEIVSRGVPESAVGIIPFPGGVVDTRDEAQALRRHLQEEPKESVIVVTTDHHTGRARRQVRQELRGLGVDVRMAAAPDPRGISPGDWWRSEEGKRIYGEELLKQVAVIGLGMVPSR